jgi:protein phosphatase 1L
MLHGVRFLCSAVAALARLAHALIIRSSLLRLMPLCSPTSAPWQQPARAAAPCKKALMALDDAKDPLQALSSSAQAPAVVVVPALKQQQQTGERVAEKKMAASKAARGRRPPRLAIPAPMACAPGVDPFGAVADLEAEVATELEVQGEGFCLASRRGVRHAMEDGYGVITDHTVQGASQLVRTSYIITSILLICYEAQCNYVLRMGILTYYLGVLDGVIFSQMKKIR